MPNFKKEENQLETRLDKWLYFIKNLEDFQHIPAIFKDEVFEQAFEKAELANLGQADRDKYEMNLKVYRDYKSTVDTAFDEGKMEGKLEGKLEVAKQLKSLGIDTKTIIESTGITLDELAKL